jgi:hypothetical protein
VTMHRQSILDPYSGLSAWKSHQQISKGEKSLLVNGTVREQSLDSAQTDGFSRGAPHRKLEPSSIQLKASRVLLDTRKSPRNQLRQNFLVVCWAPRLHGLLVDSVVGARLRWVPRTAQFYVEMSVKPSTREPHFSSRSCFWILICCFSALLRSVCQSPPFAAFVFPIKSEQAQHKKLPGPSSKELSFRSQNSSFW